MQDNQKNFGGILYFNDESPWYKANPKFFKEIVEKCRDMFSPHLLKMIDEFNVLQLEQKSLPLRCYALRRFIEAFVLCVEEKFTARKISTFLTKESNKVCAPLVYKNIINELDNEVHDNPIWLLSENSFNNLLGIINELLYLDLQVLWYVDHKNNLIKSYYEYHSHADFFVKQNRELNNKLIEDIEKQIANFNIRCAIVDIINDAYSGVTPFPSTEKLKQILLINRNISKEVVTNELIEKILKILEKYIGERKAIAIELKYFSNKSDISYLIDVIAQNYY